MHALNRLGNKLEVAIGGISQLTMKGGKLAGTITVELYNPTATAITLDHLNLTVHTVQLEGNSLDAPTNEQLEAGTKQFVGASAPGLTNLAIEAHQTTTLNIPLSVSLLQALIAIVPGLLVNGGTFWLRIGVDVGVLGMSVPDVSYLQIQKPRFGDWEIKERPDEQ